MQISVENFQLAPEAAPFNLTLQPGEITGLAGLEKAGQEEFLQSLCGLHQPAGGQILGIHPQQPLSGLPSLHAAFKYQIAYLPRDRKTEGIMAALSVLDNMSITTLKQYRKAGLLSRKQLLQNYEQFAKKLGIVAASPQHPIRTLSGGNQQKVLLARWLSANPQVLLLNDPSRGVDHPTKVMMHKLYRELAQQGKTVVLLSTEVDELLAVADRVVVFYENAVQAQLAEAELTRSNIMSAMFGVAHHAN